MRPLLTALLGDVHIAVRAEEADEARRLIESHRTELVTGQVVRLRDEFGNVWQGSGEVQDDDTIRYRFRNAQGKMISGMSDNNGILLRDEKGQTWRGYVY